MGLFSDIAKAFQSVGSELGGFFEDVGGFFRGPEFPDIPSPRTPPPPAAERPRPPSRQAPEVEEAGANVRGLLRRRGRRTTTLTPGRGEGAPATQGGTRRVLGETRR